MHSNTLKRLTILAFLVWKASCCYSQNSDLMADCEALIIGTLHYSDVNPIYKPESDSINERFKDALLGRNRLILNPDNHSEIESILKVIYINSVSEYDDSPDFRRYKVRRSICFATIALLSGSEKANTFIEYAKFSLLGSVETQDNKLLENEYLGLLILEMMLKIEENKLIGSDIEILTHYLYANRDSISEENFLEAQKIVEACRSLF